MGINPVIQDVGYEPDPHSRRGESFTARASLRSIASVIGRTHLNRKVGAYQSRLISISVPGDSTVMAASEKSGQPNQGRTLLEKP